MKPIKPLGQKAYGSIPHLPSSKLGEGDHHCHEGQAIICTLKTRNKHDLIIVQEKYDGSNVAITKKYGKILALTRSGYLASTSPYEQHYFFANWVEKNESKFNDLLNEGERICGEWMLQAHGLLYKIAKEPFIAFDFFGANNNRFVYHEFIKKVADYDITTPRLIYCDNKPISIEIAFEVLKIKNSDHPVNCVGTPEGLVYRVEHKGKVDFLAKYVRPDFQTGIYLPEISGKPTVWNCDLFNLINLQN